jgi:hypothetical protein
VDSLPTLFSDIPPWLQSNGNPTLAKCSENELLMDGFPSWLCGKEMSENSTHPNTPDEWIAFMRGSLAKTLAKLENKPVLGKEPARGFTEKSCELLAQLDLTTSSWKMSPQLKETVLNKLSKTWPSWGMTVDGCVYAHPMSGQTIIEIDGSVWPTPTTDGYKGEGQLKMLAKMCQSESEFRQMAHRTSERRKQTYWPTPTAHNSREGGYPAEHTRNTPTLSAKAGGKLNPQWVEWLMGWPINHTALKQPETVKSRSKSQQRLPSWLRSKP